MGANRSQFRAQEPEPEQHTFATSLRNALKRFGETVGIRVVVHPDAPESFWTEVDWESEKDKNAAVCEILAEVELPFLRFWAPPQMTWEEETRELRIWHHEEEKKLSVKISPDFKTVQSDPEWKEWKKGDAQRLLALPRFGRNHQDDKLFLSTKNVWTMFHTSFVKETHNFKFDFFALKNFGKTHRWDESAPRWLTPELLGVRRDLSTHLMTPKFQVVWKMLGAPPFDALVPLGSFETLDSLGIEGQHKGKNKDKDKGVFALCHAQKEMWVQSEWNHEDRLTGRDKVTLYLVRAAKDHSVPFDPIGAQELSQ